MSLNKNVLVVVILILFSIFSYFNFNELITKSKEDGYIINISGMQRMLSQKIAFNAYLLKDTNSKEYESSLKSSIDTMYQNQIKIDEFEIKGDIKVTYKNSKKINEDVFKYLKEANNFLENRDINSFEYIQNNKNILLKELNEVVTIFQEYNSNQISKIRQVSLFLFILSILLSLYIYFIILKPVADNLKKSKLDFETKNKKLNEYIEIVDKNVITSSTDKKGIITYTSEAFCKISGYTKEELIGKPHNIVRHPDMPKELYKEMWGNLKSGESWDGEIKNLKKDGGYYWVNVHISPIFDIENSITGYVAIRQDITNKKKLDEKTKEIREKNRELKRYVQMVDENVITSTTNLKGIITYVSEAFCDISGYSKEELIGKPHNIVRDPEMSSEIYEDLWKTIKDNREWEGEIRNIRKDGTYYWVLSTIAPIYDKNKKIGYMAIRQNITDKKRVEELSITDGLTGLYNRRYFNEMFTKEIARSKRDGKYLAFLILDIDHFKQYNDTYGHQAGDDVLKNVAKALKGCINRGSDFVFRLGGEEFGILFSDLNEERSLEFANRVREAIEGLKIEHSKNSASAFVTSSFGLVVQKGEEIKSEDEIYKLADEALYEAKESGRNRVVLSKKEK